MSMMASVDAQSTTAPAPGLPRVGIVAVTLPADSEPLRWVWIATGRLIVGYNPARLTRHLVQVILGERLGDYLDIDSEVAR